MKGTSMPEAVNEIHGTFVDRKAKNVGRANIKIAYQRLGDPEVPAVLLIMGVAAQSIHWPETFCRALVSRGFQIVRFDNRDSGLSSHMTNAPAPDLPAVMRGDMSCVSYTLSDMAEDCVGLLDSLGLQSAHVVGASMGGQIAQTMAIEHPDRVRSLTSMMSTTGNPAVGQTSPDVLRELFANPPAGTRAAYIETFLKASRLVGSPDFPADEQEIATTAGRAFDRSYDLVGMARQAAATVASGDRTEHLRCLRVPTLVIHGLADRMCDVSGGRATAEAIPGAALILIKGMGHNLPPGLRNRLAADIGDFVWRVERGLQRG
jgi:pimeloyl-ACP methyl ester carboxylesterase